MKFSKRSKYGNKSSKGLDGYNYSSQLEAAIGNMLYAKEKAGEIAILSRQSSVYLAGDARIQYKPDFKCLDLVSGVEFYVEAKGYQTPSWRIKLRLWKADGPAPLHIYYRANSSPEIVIPKRNNDELRPIGTVALMASLPKRKPK